MAENIEVKSKGRKKGSGSDIALSIACVVIALCTVVCVTYSIITMVRINRDYNAKEELPQIEDADYNSKEDVSSYIYKFGHLPENYVNKQEAELAGWQGGSLEAVLPGKCIGGDRIYEEYSANLNIVDETGRYYMECDVNSFGKNGRGSERLVYSNDGLVYYTADHYKTMELLYGSELLSR